MAYKEVNDLSADVTISLGGVNKKTGKKNPTEVEGYYLGRRQVADNKKKSGVSYIYILQTSKGNVGVWGKTDMDRKMVGVVPGHMIHVSHVGMVDTPNGPMYKYKVQFDPDNTVEVSGATDVASTDYKADEPLDNEESYDGEVDGLDQEDEDTPSYNQSAGRLSATASSKRMEDILNRSGGNKRK